MRLCLTLAVVGVFAVRMPLWGIDMAEIKARGTLRVLVAADEQPEMFSFRPAGPSGFERELVERFAQLQRVRLEITPMVRFADIIPMMKAGNGDLITGLIDTEQRRQEIDFTSEIWPSRIVTVNKAPAKPIRTVDVLRKQRVGVIPGNLWARVVKEAGVPAEKTVEFVDFNALLAALKDGKVSATAIALSDFLLARRRDQSLQAGMFLGDLRSGAWGVRKQDTQLRDAANAFIFATRKSGSWSRLIVTYFGEDALELLGRARAGLRQD